MTALVIVALFAAVVVWATYAYRRELRTPRPAPIVDPRRSASAGGFGPEWDELIEAHRG